MSSFHALTAGDSRTPSDTNFGVTITPNMPMPGQPARAMNAKDDNGMSNLWVKTDEATLQSIYPTTLEPVEVKRQSAVHPSLKGPMTGAHTRTDPVTGD